MIAPAVDTALFDYLLRLGDSTLVLAQRLGAWCGHGPVLEEDIACANVGLDLLGQARMWLSYAGEVESAGRGEDQLAYLRDAGAYRNLLLVERPNGDYAATMVRQLYFDAWHYHLLGGLAQSRDSRIAAIAAKAVKEAAYHLRRSSDWVIRLGDGTAESHRRVQTAAGDLWPYTGEMFTMDAIDCDLAARRLGCDLEALERPWRAHLEATFAQATLALPAPGAWMQRGGKQGVHGEGLGLLLAEMQFLQRTYPGAQW